MAHNVESIGEVADFRPENLIQAVTPLFCLYFVVQSYTHSGLLRKNFN